MVLLKYFNTSICLSIDDDFWEEVTNKSAGIEMPKELTTVVTTRLRS